VGTVAVPAAGWPFVFEAGRWKSNPNDANKPASEALLRLFLVELMLCLVEDRPGGLPRRVERCAEDVPRLVFVYCRGLFFVFCLRRRSLVVSVISLGL
jgi:hypothetical protein